jgi:hypothetical protein
MFLAELGKHIAKGIHSIVEYLEDSDSFVKRAALEGLTILASHGICSLPLLNVYVLNHAFS